MRALTWVGGCQHPFLICCRYTNIAVHTFIVLNWSSYGLYMGRNDDVGVEYKEREQHHLLFITDVPLLHIASTLRFIPVITPLSSFCGQSVR